MVLQSIQNGTKNRMISQGFGLEKITGKITTARAAPLPEADSVPAASDERAPIALCARHRPLLSHVSHRKPFVVVLVGCQLSCCTDASPFCQNTVVLRKEWSAVPTQCPRPSLPLLVVPVVSHQLAVLAELLPGCSASLHFKSTWRTRARGKRETDC